MPRETAAVKKCRNLPPCIANGKANNLQPTQHPREEEQTQPDASSDDVVVGLSSPQRGISHQTDNKYNNYYFKSATYSQD